MGGNLAELFTQMSQWSDEEVRGRAEEVHAYNNNPGLLIKSALGFIQKMSST